MSKKVFTCNSCKEEKPTSEFLKDSRIKRGHTSKCRQCNNKYQKSVRHLYAETKNKKERERYRDRVGNFTFEKVSKEDYPEKLTCSKCLQEKDSTSFTYMPKYYPTRGYPYSCKDCLAEKARLRRLSYEVDREAAKERSRNWRKQNPAHRNFLKACYKASLKSATPAWLTNFQRQEMVQIYYLAKDCSTTSGEQYQVDHIVPIRGKLVCGLHVPWNLQVLPSDINRRKSNGH